MPSRKTRATEIPKIHDSEGRLIRTFTPFDFPPTYEGHEALCDWRMAVAEEDKKNPPRHLDPEYRKRKKNESLIVRLKKQLMEAERLQQGLNGSG